MLEITSGQLHKLITKHPALLVSPTVTLKANLEAMLRLGLSLQQLSAVCLTRPSLLRVNWRSDMQVEKWSFLTQVMHHDLVFLASHSGMLGASLRNVLGPQYAYIKHLRACGIQSTRKKLLLDVLLGNDHHFMKSLIRVKLLPAALPYDANFKADFQPRWQYLTEHQGIAVRYIGLHQDILNAPLSHVLGPRIAFLQVVVAQHASFCMVDQLTNVATMSDQDFAAAYNQLDHGLALTADFIKERQSDNAHVWQTN